MWKLSEYRNKADRLTDLLPWAAVVAPGVVLNKDGSFLKAIKFRGPDLESSTEPQLVSVTARLNNALKRLSSGWAIFIEANRKHAQGYPEEGDFPDPVSWLLDAERRELFNTEGEHFESDYYLTFQYLPPKETVSKLSHFFISTQENTKGSADYRKILTFFETTVQRLYDILRDFLYEVEFLNDEGILTYLHNCISDKPHRVKPPETPAYLDALLADSPLVGGFEPKLGKHFLKTLSIMGFPSSSVPAILDQLNHLSLEYRWVTRFLPLDKLEAEKILKNYRRQWFAKRKGLFTLLTETFTKSESAMVDNAAIRKSQEVDEALQSLADDHVSFGYYTATVTVWDESLEAVIQKQRAIERVINGLGFVTVAEQVNAVEAWLSSLPGHIYANVRMPLMHSLNLAHLIPFSSPWAGPLQNDHLHAPVLLYAKTTGSMPFRFCTHIGDVGHQMVIGPTGAGKSVLLNLMALQFLRYKQAQVFIFDKGQSSLASTLSVGGHIYNAGESDNSGLVFQPLAHIDQEDERIWAHDWLLGLLLNENIKITPEVKDIVWQGLCDLASVTKKQRTLTGLKALLQHKQLRQALDSYTLGGPYGAILDADEEVFYQANWQCFEMEKLMQMPMIIAPVLSYIFHVLEKRFDGRPTLLILDEAWLFLDHSMFANKIKAWLKTLRKQNVAVIFATQSVEDLTSSKVASSLIESCPSRIFLPNDRALEPHVRETYESLGLNNRQIHILSQAVPKRQYYFQSNNGNALFELGLGQLGLALCGASSPKDKTLIQQIIKTHGLDDFYRYYLKQKGLDWAVNIIDERLERYG